MARNRVKEEREALGWTLEELSVKAQVSLYTLQKIDRNACDSTALDHAIGIAQALGKSVEEIFERTQYGLVRKRSPALPAPAQTPAQEVV